MLPVAWHAAGQMDDPVFTPDLQLRPYWWDAAPPLPAEAVLPDRAEVAIIGGGIAGLSTALELGRQGVKALVLDREAIGWGASSRNGGALSGAGGLGKLRDDLKETLGARVLAELMAEGEGAFEDFEALVAREGLAADYIRCGRFTAAHAPRALEALKRRAEMVNETGAGQAEILGRDRVAEELATTRYHGGMVLHRAGSVHPGRFTRSLAAAAARHGATLAGGVAVDSYAREGDGFLLQTSRGPLRARQLMVATNGYTGAATPWQQRRLIPVASYMIATEPLGADRVRALLPRLRVYGDTKKVLYYFRPSPDHDRILFGGRASFVDADTRRAGATLYRFLLDLFPQLAGVRVSHAWKGNVAFGFDLMPHIGTQDGVHYALACNGSGVVTMTHLGTAVARRMLGGGNDVSAFARLPFPTKPFYNGKPWFMPIVGMAYQLRDRLDGWRLANGGR
jgi:glycine/D-amino acid oxidase-like deaminating enzyme